VEDKTVPFPPFFFLVSRERQLFFFPPLVLSSFPVALFLRADRKTLSFLFGYPDSDGYGVRLHSLRERRVFPPPPPFPLNPLGRETTDWRGPLTPFSLERKGKAFYPFLPSRFSLFLDMESGIEWGLGFSFLLDLAQSFLSLFLAAATKAASDLFLAFLPPFFSRDCGRN